MLCRQAALLSSWSNKPPPITQEFYVLSVPFFITIYFFYFPNYFYKLFHQGTKRSSVSCRWWYKHHYKFIVKSICNCRKFISIYSVVGNLRLLFIYLEVQFSVLKASFTYLYTTMIISAVWHYDISDFLLNRHFKTKMIDLLTEKLTLNRHSYLFFILFTSKGHNSQILLLIVNKLSISLLNIRRWSI